VGRTPHNPRSHRPASRPHKQLHPWRVRRLLQPRHGLPRRQHVERHPLTKTQDDSSQSWPLAPAKRLARRRTMTESTRPPGETKPGNQARPAIPSFPLRFQHSEGRTSYALRWLDRNRPPPEASLTRCFAMGIPTRLCQIFTAIHPLNAHSTPVSFLHHPPTASEKYEPGRRRQRPQRILF
jgi:hypothetical protein